MGLSKQNAEVFSDEEGYLFLIFTDEELRQIIHRNRKTANARKKELEKFGLLITFEWVTKKLTVFIYWNQKSVIQRNISNRYRQKKKAEIAEKQRKQAEALKKKYVMIAVPENRKQTYLYVG